MGRITVPRLFKCTLMVVSVALSVSLSVSGPSSLKFGSAGPGPAGLSRFLRGVDGTLSLRGGMGNFADTVVFPRYGWDQSPEEVKIYVFLDGIPCAWDGKEGSPTGESLRVDITPNWLGVRAGGLKGQDYELIIPELFAEV